MRRTLTSSALAVALLLASAPAVKAQYTTDALPADAPAPAVATEHKDKARGLREWPGRYRLTFSYQLGRGQPDTVLTAKWVRNPVILISDDLEEDEERNFGVQVGLEHALAKRLTARVELGYQRSQTRFFRPYSPYWMAPLHQRVPLTLSFLDRYHRHYGTLTLGARYRVFGPLAIGLDVRQELLVASQAWDIEPPRDFWPRPSYPSWEEPQDKFNTWRYEGVEVVPRVALVTRYGEVSFGVRAWRWERVDRLIYDMLPGDPEPGYRQRTLPMRYFTAQVKIPLSRGQEVGLWGE